MEKQTPNIFPLNVLLKRRWSPTIFADRPIDSGHLNSLFEAARWSASCFNEQPWNFVLASRHADFAVFQALAGCLTPGNAWALKAPHLMFSVAKLNFDKTGKPNRYAWYDSGQAIAHLSIQAVELDIFVHQMAGFDAAGAKAAMKVPETHEVVCAIALGYGADASQVPFESKAREEGPRLRKEAAQFLRLGHF